MSALPPPAALAHAARLLEGHGFSVVGRNDRGDSLYLRQAGCAWALRLSNHARTAKQRGKRTDVLASLVIRRPRAPDQVAAMVAAAVRDFTAARAGALSDEEDAGSSKVECGKSEA